MLTLAGLVFVLVRGGVVLAGQAIASLAAGGGVKTVVQSVARVTSRVGVSSAELDEKLQSLSQNAVALGVAVAQEIAAATASMLLSLFFAMLTMHYIIRNWGFVTLRAQEAFPLRPDYTRTLFAEFRRVGRTTLMGTIVTGIAQGLLATIGYWICGLREPIFFGAATAVEKPSEAAARRSDIALPAELFAFTLSHRRCPRSLVFRR